MPRSDARIVFCFFSATALQAGMLIAAARSDTPVVVELHAPMTPKQRKWLRTMRVRVRLMAYLGHDEASAALLHNVRTLVGASLHSSA